MRRIEASRQAARLTGLYGMLAVFAINRGFCADANTPGTTDPLLDLFIKKGYVTQEEAEKVKAEADFNQTNGVAAASSLSKWKISNGVKSVELFGDIRVRYEDRSVHDPKNGYIDLERYRYAIRLGLRGDALDNFYYGLRMETSANPRSPWVTMGTSASGKPYQGPFGKSTAGINIGQAYLGWKPGDWINITVGKMPQPLYTTPMIWDTDLNPEGAAENFKYTVGEADFFATFGQFIYQDTNPNSASPKFGYFGSSSPPVNGGGSAATFLLAWQGGFNYHLPKKMSLKVAPVIYIYSGNGANTSPGTPGFSDVFVGQGATNGPQGTVGYDGYPTGYFDGFNANQTGINDLEVLDFPFEFNFKIARLNARFFGDYAYNFQGATRAQDAYKAALAESSPLYTLPDGSTPPYPTRPISSPQTHDVHAYQIGFGLGSDDLAYGPMQGEVYGNSSRKHAWEFRTYWQHIEQYALDPNLIDSDFFEGRENLQGIYAAFAYGLSDNVIGTIRYGHASRINDKLGTGGSNQDIPQMNPINTYNILQVDLAFHF